MTYLRLSIATILLACATSAAAQQGPAKKKLYCWTENGHKVCGDALPANAANDARTEFSAASGRQTGSVNRALTTEEQAAAASAEIGRASCRERV